MHRKLLIANFLGSPFNIRKPILTLLLVRPDQQVRELPTGCARLRKEFGYRQLE
jgi:hypothetical protein